MFLMRGLAALAAVALIGAAQGACGGLGQSDAESRCNQERKNRPNCFDDTAFTACEACYERCGDSCQAQSTTCPVTYYCPGDATADGGTH